MKFSTKLTITALLTILWSSYIYSAVKSNTSFPMGINMDNYKPTLNKLDLIYPKELPEISSNFNDGKYRIATIKLKKIYKMNVPDGNRDVVCLMLAECFRKLQLDSISVEYYKEYIDNYPKGSFFTYSLYRLQDYYYRNNFLSKSDSVSTIVQNSFKNDKYYGASLYIEVKSLIKQEKFNKAIKTISKIPKETNFYIPATFLNGICHVLIGNYIKAIILFDFVSTTSENTQLADEARLQKGKLYYKIKQYNTALSVFEKIKEKKRYTNRIGLIKANILIEQKQYDKAITEVKKIINKIPESEYTFEAYLLLVKIYTTMGANKKASRAMAIANKYARNFSNLFAISREFKQLEIDEASWKRIISKAKKLKGYDNKELQKTAQKKLENISLLRKKLFKLQNKIDPSKRIKLITGSTSILEQMYLVTLESKIQSLKEDSSDYFTELQVAKLDLETSIDNNEAKKFQKIYTLVEKEYNGICTNLKRLRYTKKYLSNKNNFSDNQMNSRARELQTKFIDWGYINLGKIKEDIQKENYKISDYNKKIALFKEYIIKKRKEKSHNN